MMSIPGILNMNVMGEGQMMWREGKSVTTPDRKAENEVYLQKSCQSSVLQESYPQAKKFATELSMLLAWRWQRGEGVAPRPPLYH